MPKGIVRKLDKLGRATLPIEYRTTAGIKEGDLLGIRLDGKVIRLYIKPFLGTVRAIDDLGRITIPIEIRRSLKFQEHELVDMYIEGDEICIRKETLQCVFCECDDEDILVVRNGVHACEECIEELQVFIERNADAHVTENQDEK